MKVLVARLCPILCDPMDCGPPGSAVHRILQARILEWVAIPFSRDLLNPGIELRFPALQAESLPSEPPGRPYGPMDVDNLISISSAFSKASLYIWKFLVHVLLKPSLEDFEHYFASM